LVEQAFVLPGLLSEALSCQVGKPFIGRFAASGLIDESGSRSLPDSDNDTV